MNIVIWDCNRWSTVNCNVLYLLNYYLIPFRVLYFESIPLITKKKSNKHSPKGKTERKKRYPNRNCFFFYCFIDTRSCCTGITSLFIFITLLLSFRIEIF